MRLPLPMGRPCATSKGYLQKEVPPWPAAPRTSQQLHDLVAQTAAVAQKHGEVRLLSDLLQDLELAQPHQRRARIENPGRVGLHTHRRRLLTPRDQGRLGSLLRFGHAVHQILHLARENYVADTDRDDLDAERRGTDADRLIELARDSIARRQKRIEV